MGTDFAAFAQGALDFAVQQLLNGIDNPRLDDTIRETRRSAAMAP
jgi:hypothetical protein